MIKFYPIIDKKLKKSTLISDLATFKSKSMQLWEYQYSNGSHQDHEYAGEIRGWFKACDKYNPQAGLELVDMVVYQWVYEFGCVACTSIVWFEGDGVRSPKVRLASNLDYWYAELFTSLTHHAVYKYRESVLFEADYILGFYGFTRVFKKIDSSEQKNMGDNEGNSKNVLKNKNENEKNSLDSDSKAPNNDDRSHILQMSLNQRSNVKGIEPFLQSVLDKTNTNVLRHFRNSFHLSENYSYLRAKITNVANLYLGAPFYSILNNESEGCVIEMD